MPIWLDQPQDFRIGASITHKEGQSHGLQSILGCYGYVHEYLFMLTKSWLVICKWWDREREGGEEGASGDSQSDPTVESVEEIRLMLRELNT